MLDYRLTYGNKVVHDLGLGVACTSATCDMEAGIAGELKFELDPTHPLAREAFPVKDVSREVVLEDRGRELFRGRITSVDGDSGAMRTVTVEGQLAYLGDSTVRDYSTVDADDLPTGTTLVGGSVLAHLIDAHNRRMGADKSFAVGEGATIWAAVTTTDKPTTLDEINRTLCEGQDRYLRARYASGQRIIDVLDGGQGVGTQTIVFGENLMDFASARSWDDLVTAIIPSAQWDRNGEEHLPLDVIGEDPIPAPEKTTATNYTQGETTFGAELISDGKVTVNDVPVTVDGDRIIGDELAAAYGIFEEARSYDAKTPDQLLRLVAADLNPRASNIRELESVDVSAFDLSATNPELEPIELLQWCRVYAPPYHVDQWMPCSKLHIDIVHPEETEYHFGDIPKTLTRQSALRMGLIQRGTGDLIRKANGAARDADMLHLETNHNSDRITEEAKKAEENLKTATDNWSAHLDEETAKWYESLSDAEKEAAQGREELQKHLDGLGTTMEGVQQLADAAQRTFYGVCNTSGSVSAKVVQSSYLTKPGGQTFALQEGVVVEVKFTEADTSGNPTLNIAGTGAHAIYCYGSNQGIWRANQVMRFVYDGSVWQCTNAPLYGSPLIVGNPAQGNLYSDGNNLDMRIGSTAYWHVDASGQRVGLKDEANIKLSGNQIEITGSSKVSSLDPTVLTIVTPTIAPSKPGEGVRGTAEISSNRSISIQDGSGHELSMQEQTYSIKSGTARLYINGTYAIFGSEAPMSMSNLILNTRYLYRNRALVVCTSITKSVSNSDYLKLESSDLGVQSGGYVWVVQNGDHDACDFYTVGNSITRNGGLWVKFDRVVNTTVRLNVYGYPTPLAYPTGSDPANPEAPEIFADPQEPEQPTVEEAANAAQ